MVTKPLTSDGIRTHDLPTEHHLDQLSIYPYNLFSFLPDPPYLGPSLVAGSLGDLVAFANKQLMPM